MVIWPNKGLRNVDEWMDGRIEGGMITDRQKAKTQQCIIKSRSSGVVLKIDGCFQTKDLLLLCLRSSTWLILIQSENAQTLPVSCRAYLFSFFVAFFFFLVCLFPATERKHSSLQEASWTKRCTPGLDSSFHSILQGWMETAAVDPRAP